jgi:hypothetical protein
VKNWQEACLVLNPFSCYPVPVIFLFAGNLFSWHRLLRRSLVLQDMKAAAGGDEIADWLLNLLVT